MTTTAWIIYNEHQTPTQWRFYKTKKECKAEIDRVFTPELQRLGSVEPVKVTLEFHI